MTGLTVPEKTMLLSKAAWGLTYCEPTQGWPSQWTIVWRAEKYHGKIGTFIKSKNKPTAKKIDAALEKELLKRMRSMLRCDAKRVAYLWLSDNSKALPMQTNQTFKILQDALYDLDERIAGEFFSNENPKLFMGTTHGWILAEIAEIRCLVSSLSQAATKGGAK